MLPDGLLWRVITTCFLLFDYFLFTAGNPSLSYSLLGGWFWVTLFAAVIIVSSYAPPSFSGNAARPFYLLLSIVGVFSVVLFFASPYAHDLAANRMEAEILSFMKDPENSKVDALREERQLMVDLKSVKYHKERSVFIPTFREMDYHLTTETGEKYRIRMRIGWSGTPAISVGRVNS